MANCVVCGMFTQVLPKLTCQYHEKEAEAQSSVDNRAFCDGIHRSAWPAPVVSRV